MMKEYYEVVVEGAIECVKAFVFGYLEGSEIEGELIFGEDHHVENESRLGQLMRLINVRGERVHLIVGGGFHKRLKDALEKRKHEIKLKIISEKLIGTAYFDFSYRAYTRELGEELKSIFGSVSKSEDGLHMEAGYKPREEIHPEGKGVEGYAPLHEYEIKANGRIHGPVKEVIEFYGKVEHYDLVELGDIRLEYAD